MVLAKCAFYRPKISKLYFYSLRITSSACLSVCLSAPSDAVFRPLIGPQIIWSVPRPQLIEKFSVSCTWDFFLHHEFNILNRNLWSCNTHLKEGKTLYLSNRVSYKVLLLNLTKNCCPCFILKWYQLNPLICYHFNPWYGIRSTPDILQNLKAKRTSFCVVCREILFNIYITNT